ncbi:MAG: PAC2 family protein [Myxococcota bacterium]
MRDVLTFHVEPQLRDATLIAAFEGWNDAGEAATGAARFLSDAIAAVPLAEIDGEPYLDFTVTRPWVRTDETGRRRVEWPGTHFSYGATGAACELVIARGAEPHLRWRDYCDQFAAVVTRLGIRRVVLLGAYVADVVYSRPVGVTGFADDEDRLHDIGVEPSRYEGPTGIVGVLGERLSSEGVEVLSLWAGLPHYISASPNPRGSLALVHKLRAALALAVDDEPLQQEAAAFEQKISALVSGDPELSEYVRQLKRREFAQ